MPDDKDELERAYQYSARLVGDQKKLPLVARAIFPGKALEESTLFNGEVDLAPWPAIVDQPSSELGKERTRRQFLAA